jgi:hypothetical protein
VGPEAFWTQWKIEISFASAVNRTPVFHPTSQVRAKCEQRGTAILVEYKSVSSDIKISRIMGCFTMLTVYGVCSY